ncbi:hypothetical protein Misp01_01390 [Microtetraspora sp. NBRC 13810]|uniref:hypothetical protein n=1 Tax=Microtetraspora sp. NBRC 13810 TaxID=3030990 RepID=UPI0024A3B57B|nr:hypothetical protein [Microtetraspora sp. NBRC 13810]GLW05009.1 hypothetical protein Misp01_01390 [Microtetraspora sp. NBRC 13810]
MTSRDAMYGGGEAVPLDPDWPGLTGAGATSEFDAGRMRDVAGRLQKFVDALNGPGAAEGYTTGTLASLRDHAVLSEQHLGTWQAPSALAKSVGSGSGPREDRGYALSTVYGMLAARCQDVVNELYRQADEYERAHAKSHVNS